MQKTILFVAFGKEEPGLYGSHAMVEKLTKDEEAKYCEMINIDSLGLGAVQSADNMSSAKMTAFAGDVAKGLKLPFAHAPIQGADADSSSFIAKKIPAITIHGLTVDWPRVLHTVNDQPKKVNPVSVYLGYRLVLEMVIQLDKHGCSEFR